MRKYHDKHNMLIYCGATNLMQQDVDDICVKEDVRQIDYISQILNLEYDMITAQFTSKENKLEREHRLEQFKNKDINALIAIKCLDEGINIPQIDTAFILASTTNPKEYIQRRGRVLRKAPDKLYASIYDFITLPRAIENIDKINNIDLSLVKKELIRLNEFKRIAINKHESDNYIYEIIDAYNLYDFEVILKNNEECNNLWMI